MAAPLTRNSILGDDLDKDFKIITIDLPGHGEREDPERQTPEAVLDVVLQASEELDAVCDEAARQLDADPTRIAIGGMSAGGMAAIHRATPPHAYAALTLEATSGAWSHLPMATNSSPDLRSRVETADPIRNLAGWRPIPVLSVHARYDTWIPQTEQWKFLDAIESLGDPALIHRVRYDRTGADAEHAGFGRYSADAKEQQCRFLTECLFAGAPTYDI